MKTLFIPAAILFSIFVSAQNDAANGDWKKRYVVKEKSGECEFMIRQGDIDNLGFGWEAGFNPFSGKSTPAHAFPWERDTTEILGYDMIQVPSAAGKEGAKSCGYDGYSGEKENLIVRHKSSVFPFVIPISGVDTSKVKGVTLQLFVDDFQSPVTCSRFQVMLNDKPFPEFTKMINSLNQTGPIGKIITIKVPAALINEFKKKEVKLFFDDKTTGAGDGFAIDFIKIMYNPFKYLTGNYLGTLKGIAGNPVANVTVECGEMKTQTDAKGNFKFSGLVAGLNVITVHAPGIPEKNMTIDVEANQTTMEDLIFQKD